MVLNSKKEKTTVPLRPCCEKAADTDGGWRVIDGGWRVTDGIWRVTDGGWTVTDGGWVTDGGSSLWKNALKGSPE